MTLIHVVGRERIAILSYRHGGLMCFHCLSIVTQIPFLDKVELSVPKIRRLLWRVVLAVEQTLSHIRAWSQWRRRHQNLVKYYHDKRHGALAELLAA
jgi:hypothetical protein